MLLQEREDIYDNADSVIKSWIDKDIKYNHFRYEDVELIHIDKNGDVELNELIQKFDTLKYFRESGQEEFLSIATLAKIHFSKMDNGDE